MKMKTISLSLFFCLLTLSISAHDHFPKLESSIDKAIAGSLQEITYTYTVGDELIKKGGGIRIEYPAAFGETEFLFWSKPQTDEPDLLGYITGKTSTGLEVSLVTYGLAGGIFQCTLKEGELNKGDKLYIKYKGLVQSLARDFIVRAQERSASGNAWHKIHNPPIIKILPQKGKTIILTSPADLVAGKNFELSVVILDKFGNLATGYNGEVSFESTDKNAIIPNTYLFTEKGKHTFKNVKYNTLGFQKITAQTTDGLKTSVHYSYVSENKPLYKRYFGDTHFHTGSGTLNQGFFGIEPHDHDHDHKHSNVKMLSRKDFLKFNAGGDHKGNFSTAREAYTYAKEVTKLDFASSSEHDASFFDNNAWEISQNVTDEFYSPGKFTTFYAYEWTPGIIHHIIMYKDRDLSVFDRRLYPDLPSLWSAFDKQGKPVICIPHLTWNFKEHINWEHINNTYRKLGEIYSLWNSRFLLQPGDEPQRFELGKDNKWSFQHAWHKGHKIGVVGSSDNHLAQPGVNNYTIYTQHAGGLAVAISKENNRTELWNAMENRRTYATTGTRIYVDFTVNDSPMGSEIQSQNAPWIKGKVAGTNKLETVEVVKYANGEYTSVYTKSPDSETLEFSFIDKNFDSDCFYYLRVFQVSEVPGRLWTYPTNEMAWSSPIWVEYKN